MTPHGVPISPDGRFEWDGQRWVATREQRRRTMLMAFGIVTAVLVMNLSLMVFVFAPTIIVLIKVFHSD